MAAEKDNDTRTNAQSSGLESRTHTPGPWKVMPDPSYPEGLHPLHHHRFITTEAMGVEGDDFDGEGSIICALRDQERQAADARLIAAAPDMLDALITTGHDLAEISLWIKCPESKPEAKLASIASLLKHNQSKRNAAISSAQ